MRVRVKMLVARSIASFLGLCIVSCAEDNAIILLQQSAKFVATPEYDASRIDIQPVAHTPDETLVAFGREIRAMQLSTAFRLLNQNSRRVLASRKRKLFFCSIFKNAATEFLSLLMRAEGLDETHWNPGRHGVAEDSVHADPAREVLFFNRNLSDVSPVNELNGIVNGSTPGWTRGIVLRDPVERLVSAWVSKVQSNTREQTLQPPVIPHHTSFEDMVALLEDYGDLARADPHLRLQSVQCGLDEVGSLEKFDVIGNMHSVAQDSREMLTAAGGRNFADEMLNKGWGSDGTKPLFSLTRSQREHGNGDVMESGGTDEFVQSLSPELIARINKLYAADVELIAHANRIRAKLRK